jgi:hypothetical protein
VLENVAGEVVVETWDRGELQIRSADEGRSLAVRRTASRLELRPEDSKGRRREVEVRIRIPTWVDLAISGRSLEVDVNGVAGSLSIDTGSGRVIADGIEARTLGVDTGSGSVRLERIRSSDVVVDTGSGSVDVELLTDVESLEVDTGSGSVTVRALSDLSASLEIDTGSGGIDVEFPVEARSVRRDSMRGRIGDGRGEIVIDTGSGSIKLLRSGGRPC